MLEIKNIILKNLGYTELVYGRINKKLKTDMEKKEIEDLIYKAIKEIENEKISKTGKNYYISSSKFGFRVTINSNSFRVITVDRI